MIRVLMIGILVLVIGMSNPIQLNAQIDAKEEFEKMIAHPEAYDSYQRVELYNDYAAPMYSSSLDSVLSVYVEMQAFGEGIKDSFVIAMALTSMAAINKMTGKNTKTFEQLLDATPFFKNYPEELLKNLAAIGTEATILGKYDIAIEYIDKAFKQHEVVNKSANLTELYLVKGNYYESQAQYHSALTAYLKSMEYKETVMSPLKVANIYLNISQLYNRINDPEKALQYLAYVDEIVKENGYKMTANTLDLKRGAYYMKELDFDKAEFHYLAALHYLKEKKVSYKLLNVYSNLSIISLNQNKLNEAKEYIDLALKQQDSTITNSGKSALYNAQYRYDQAIGNFKESKTPLLEMLAVAEKTDNYNKASIAFKGLIKLYEHEKNWKQVAFYQNKLITDSKKQNLAAQKNLLYDLDNKYQNEQKELSIKGLEAENQLKELELSQKKMENRFYLGLLALALFALLALRYAYVSIRKVNVKLSDSNDQLFKALNSNKMLLKEIHHRVKNNLQVISSLLGLQQAYLTDSEAKKAIQTSKTRVQSMSLLHQKLYQGEDITKVNIKDYFENLTLNLFQTYKVSQDKIELHQNIEPLVLDVDTVITMGLIFNELMSNALKYAFKAEEEGVIHVSVKQVGDRINMMVSDNGEGVKFKKLPMRSTSLGMNLVRSFTTKLQGEVEIDNHNGTRFEIAFPLHSKVA